MAEGEEESPMPEEVVEEVQQEFGQKPEGERVGWNEKFNRAADELGNRMREVDERPLSRRALEPIDLFITRETLRTVKDLAELAAKTTGGRRPSSRQPK